MDNADRIQAILNALQRAQKALPATGDPQTSEFSNAMTTIISLLDEFREDSPDRFTQDWAGEIHQCVIELNLMGIQFVAAKKHIAEQESIIDQDYLDRLDRETREFINLMRGYVERLRTKQVDP